MKLRIDQIIVSKDNPRQSFDEEGLRRLGESIKTHGQLQPIIVRPLGSNFELVVGERRLRASALVGLTEIEATVKEVDDSSVMEFRLIENTQREDLSDAEKGDAVLSLWANYDKYEQIKSVADAIKIPYNTVTMWIQEARHLSDKVKQYLATNTLTNEHGKSLVKYSHSIQDKLANTIIKRGISSHKEVLRRFTKLYDADSKRNLDEIADEVLGIETVTIPKKEIPSEILEKIEEKKQLAKVHRVRTKPSKPITKEQVKEKLAKKTDFKFERVKVSRGVKGLEAPFKREVKPLAVPIPKKPDYAVCQCATCQLFGKHCKGRCWT